MSDFLRALRADLLSRRMLPLLALVSVALVAALAYALLGSGGSHAPGAPGAAVPGQSSTTSLTAAPANSQEAVAETAVGGRYQHKGSARDPFTPLPETGQAVSSSSSASSTQGSATSSSSASVGQSTVQASPGESSSTGTGGSGTSPELPTVAPAEGPAKPSQPKQSTTVYEVSVQVQQLATVEGSQTTTTPAGTTTTPPEGQTTTPSEGQAGAEAALPVLADIPRGQELPDAQTPLLVFAGVLKGGKQAIFKLVGEAFPASGAHCIPSTLQCEALKLGAGTTEGLSYTAAGQTVAYRIEVTTIVASTVSAADAKKLHERRSRAGIALLGESLPGGLSYSSRRGVLVTAGH